MVPRNVRVIARDRHSLLCAVDIHRLARGCHHARQHRLRRVDLRQQQRGLVAALTATEVVRPQAGDQAALRHGQYLGAADVTERVVDPLEAVEVEAADRAQRRDRAAPARAARAVWCRTQRGS